MRYNYDGLCFSPDLRSVLESQALRTDYDLLHFLEAYKYYTEEDLVRCLEGQIDDIGCCEVVNRSDKYRILENKYGVVIDETSDRLRILYSCMTEIQRNNILLETQVDSKNLRFVSITPFQFDLLRGTVIRYDPLQKLKRILIEAIEKHATDVHFEVRHTESGVTYPVLFRIDGKLRENSLFELDSDDNKKVIGALIEKKTSANALDLLESAGVTASSAGILDNDVELRICANKVRDGYHCVIRMQRKTTVSLHINELGFDDTVNTALYYVAEKRSGVTFITGAIRTGKNTTAFAIANEMSEQPIKIVSYESPIEVLMPFPQVDYHENPQVLLDAIKLSKKQDVNVAFINEIPTNDVAFAVQDLVNSSIHVITTMHMDRVWHLPYKLREYYGDSYKDILSQINVVFNQKMFDKKCPCCKEKILVDSIEDKRIIDLLKRNDVKFAWSNTGCSKCNYTGTIPGSNQPYVEFVVFTDELVSELLKCTAPYEMESILRKAADTVSLERFMTAAVANGDLDWRALKSLV